MRLNLYFALSILLVTMLSCDANNSGNSRQSAAPAQTSATNQATPVSPNAPATTAAATTASAANAFDPCSLITADDIKAVQGEAAQEMKPSRRSSDTAFAVAQCFYQTPTFTKSVSLEVTQRGTSTQSVRDFWKGNFAAALAKRDKKNERRKKQGKPQAGEPATPIAGLGDEAYWISTNANSTLYAFKNDTLIRLSIGGADTEEARMKKIKTLAERALARL